MQRDRAWECDRPQEDDEYRATVTRIQALLEERGPRYSAADLHVSLAAESDGADDVGAPAAVVAWRCALTCMAF